MNNVRGEIMKKYFAVFLIAIVSVAMLRADMGSIPFDPDVQIFEPNQNAFIAWNGVEELLLLATDLRASRPVKVLEVMPFPSEPEVREGDRGIFTRAIRLINSKQKKRHNETLGLDSLSYSSGAAKRAPAGTITFHERIGAHDISVTRVNRTSGFIKWAEGYLRSQGAETPKIPYELKQVISEYLEDGYSWFVFDVIELGTSLKSKDAIEFQFTSDKVYFPLRITRTESGWTTVDLIVLTEKLLSNFHGISRNRIELRHDPVNVNRRELNEIDDSLSYFFRQCSRLLKLRLWRIAGPANAFRHDLMVN